MKCRVLYIGIYLILLAFLATLDLVVRIVHVLLLFVFLNGMSIEKMKFWLLHMKVFRILGTAPVCSMLVRVDFEI